MPYRRELFKNGHYYHIFNKTIEHIKCFDNAGLCTLFLETAQYYRCAELPIRFSRFRSIDKMRKLMIKEFIKDQAKFQVNIVSYALMPNHYHFVVRQKKDNGVNAFISNLTNSFTRYYNIGNERKGPLFLPRFHSVAVLSTEQLLHVCRYVHVNPFAAGLVSSLRMLRYYPWTSYREYMRTTTAHLTQTNFLLRYFKNDRELLRSFTESELDQKKTLQHIREVEMLNQF